MTNQPATPEPADDAKVPVLANPTRTRITEVYKVGDLTAGVDPRDPRPVVINLDGLTLTHINGQPTGPEGWVIEQARVVNEPEIPAQSLELTVWVGGQMVAIFVTADTTQNIGLVDDRAAN